ncbi:MAG: ABC transporter ATP-binding protein [Gordonia sp. (in: high G+C Gram-positive bacteria)]
MSDTGPAVSGLAISGLAVTRRGRGTSTTIVADIDLRVGRGEAVGVVGESGSGKSMILRAIMALLPVGLVASAGEICLDGVVLPHGPARAARAARGHRIGLILQDPATALDPLIRVGEQIAQVRRHVIGRRAADARADALELLDRVRIPDARNRYRAYPHELSGGQRQRIVIARALAAEPEFLLCDEPTTALDVTVQAEVMALLDDLRTTRSVGVLLVSHDLPVVAGFSSRIIVVESGRIVEQGPTRQVLSSPRDTYTRGLLNSVIDLETHDVETSEREAP